MRFTLKQARNLAGMTQAEMAKILGIDRGTYIKIEKDVTRATVAQVKAISSATGIPTTDIFLFDDSTNVDDPRLTHQPGSLLMDSGRESA